MREREEENLVKKQWKMASRKYGDDNGKTICRLGKLLRFNMTHERKREESKEI